MQKNNEHVVAEQLARMIRRAQHKLDYFSNRLTRARFVDLPSQRLIRTAEAQVYWYTEEIAALTLELQKVERQFVPMLQVRQTTESDIRGIYPWLIEPDAWPMLGLEKPPSPEEWGMRIQRWLMEPEYQPFSIMRYNGTLIGFALLRRLGRIREETVGKLEMLILSPQWRNLGYGSEALRKIMAQAFQRLGCANSELVVECDNLQAVRCFERVGFQAIAIRQRQEVELFEMELDAFGLLTGTEKEEVQRIEVVYGADPQNLPQSALSYQLSAMRQQFKQF